MMNSLRLALIADIHHGHITETKAGPAALDLLEQVIRAATDARPDLVVDLGDRINDLDHETDLGRLRDVATCFRALRDPCVHLLGNHDQVNLSVAESEAVLNVTLGSHTVDLRGWHLVFWYPSSRPGVRGRYKIGAQDLAWLEADLAATDLRSIVFTHVPFDGGSMVSNYYFERSPAGVAGYLNAECARRVIQHSARVALVVAGHVHWNALNVIDGVPYITLQSLTETFTTHPHPAGAWAMFEIGPDTLNLRVLGRDRFDLSLPIMPHGYHWLSRTDDRPESGDARPRSAPETPANPLAGVRGVILDLDGVVYKDDVLLPGAREFLSLLRETGRRVVALTNHSGMSAAEYADKLRRMGVAIPEENIVTSTWATAQHLGRVHPGARVLVVGSDALRHGLRFAGFIESPDPDYVVVGYEPALRWPELAQATRCLLRGARLIGTNGDRLRPTSAGFVPECGPVVAFLERASGQQATIVGKPNPIIVEAALERLGVDRADALIVGDTLETDIQAGLTANIRTALVLTGNTTHAPTGQCNPTITVPNLEALCDQLVAESNPSGCWPGNPSPDNSRSLGQGTRFERGTPGQIDV